MARPFHELRERLLRKGVAPRHVYRYCNELSDHLADLTVEERSAGKSAGDAESAALLRLGTTEELVEALTSQPQFQSWTARAPWAAFTVAAFAFLFGFYLLSLFILWSGWQMFLPGADTPFGGHELNQFGRLYFQTGKFLYYSAPILAGWATAMMAARQRTRSLAPLAGLVFASLLGAMARVQASRGELAHVFGHIRMSFTWSASCLVPASVVFAIAALPYLVWRLQSASSRFRVAR